MANFVNLDYKAINMDNVISIIKEDHPIDNSDPLFGMDYYLVFRFINKSKECVYFASEEERDNAYNNIIKEN